MSAPAPPDHPAATLRPADGLARIRDVARRCRACDLWEQATQTVFGEGAPGAPLLLVGEQPGDREDRDGSPFVGPAGELLDRALADAGIDRERAFVTNVVKHFKWRPAGKRRLHERPNAAEVRACRPWLDLELDLVRPEVVVALGATAAAALLGGEFRITRDRGMVVPAADGAPARVATYHPSAVLRARDAAAREATYRWLVEDLVVAARVAGLGR